MSALPAQTRFSAKLAARSPWAACLCALVLFTPPCPGQQPDGDERLQVEFRQSVETDDAEIGESACTKLGTGLTVRPRKVCPRGYAHRSSTGSFHASARNFHGGSVEAPPVHLKWP